MGVWLPYAGPILPVKTEMPDAPTKPPRTTAKGEIVRRCKVTAKNRAVTWENFTERRGKASIVTLACGARVKVPLQTKTGATVRCEKCTTAAQLAWLKQERSASPKLQHLRAQHNPAYAGELERQQEWERRHEAELASGRPGID